MAIKNPKLFGLDVNRAFADVRDRLIALENIGLPPNDLEIIAGSAQAGALQSDWRSFSRLIEPLHETLDRFNRDSSVFDTLIASRSGTDGALFGNLKINGALSGSAIRYRYVDGTGPSAPVKFADISTSRVSAWSSSDDRANSSNPDIQKLAKISYGAKIKIVSGGKLVFMPQSSNVTGPRLQTSIVPLAKEFDSEFPTHKIKATIGAKTVNFYAMKGIPIIFKGFFRSIDPSITLTQLINGTPASWKIVETGNANNYSNFSNIGDTSTSISYRSSVSRERFIQFYYNPDNIKEVTITSANISELPAVKFANATSLNFSLNNIRNFPDLNSIAPQIRTVTLNRNPFYLSETESERKLQSTESSSYTGTLTLADGSVKTSTVLDKIPNTVTTLNIGESFFGSITQNIFADRFTNLVSFNISRGGGANFHPDSVDSSSPLPNVPNSVESYSVASNDFRSIDTSAPGSGVRFNVSQLTNVINIDLSSNYFLSGSWSIALNNVVIKSISIAGTGLAFPAGLAGKNSLETFNATNARGSGKLVDLEGGNSVGYVFDNCTSLTSLPLNGAGISGSRFPVFTNPSLTSIDMRRTSVKGGAPDGNETFVIPRNTFQFATKLNAIYIQSSSLLTSPIEFNAFGDLQDLSTILYDSSRRTTGAIPSFQGNPKLSYINMSNNAFTGSPPNLSSNSQIRYANFSVNKLNGIIPSYQNLGNLRELYLQSNQLKDIGNFVTLPNLTYLYIQDNLIGQQGSAEIPDLSDCPSLRFFVAYNNLFKNYKPGAFANLTQIRLIDVSDNPFTEQAMEKMLEDLFDNWSKAKRGSVTINLRGCGQQSETALEFIAILRSNGWSITID